MTRAEVVARLLELDTAKLEPPERLRRRKVTIIGDSSMFDRRGEMAGPCFEPVD